MRDDLLDAREALNWAIAQMKILNGRISIWIKSRPYGAIVEPDSNPAYDIVKLRHNGPPLPLIINAEAGAIINMIRSSLDLLAVALAERNGHIAPKDVYFPIADSVLSFIDPKDGAIKKIARLTENDRKRIERLKPYKGGDDLLYSLHQFDIMRKHRRLVRAHIRLRNINVWRVGHHPDAKWIYSGSLEDGTPLCLIAGGTHHDTKVTPEIFLAETTIPYRGPIRTALPTIAKRVEEIISMFDNP